jgi:putative membrane fusion protein
MKKSYAGTILKILLALSMLVVAVNAVRMSNTKYSVQSAKTGSYINSVDVEGYIVRSETVIPTSVTGIVEANVQEGDRVAANSSLGAVVTGEIDAQMTSEIDELNKRIESIKKSVSESGVLTIDDSKISATLELSLKNLKYAAAKGNVESMVSLSDDIQILTERRAGLTSDSVAQQNLDSLIAKRDSISESLGGVRQEIYAPSAGLYSENVDGLEDVLTISSLDNIVPSKVESFDSLYEGAVPSGLCKVVDNYVWYVVFNISKSDLEGMGKDHGYSVTFKDSGDKSLTGLVTYISDFDENDMCSVVMRFTGYLENFTSLRKVNLSVCKEKYTGIYIPVDAMKVVDGVTGVYVRREKSTEFKTIDIIYRSDDFVLAKNDTSEEDSSGKLKLYDSIILNPQEE